MKLENRNSKRWTKQIGAFLLLIGLAAWLGGFTPALADTGNVLSNGSFVDCTGLPLLPDRWINTGNVQWTCSAGTISAMITDGTTQAAHLFQCSTLSVLAGNPEDWEAGVSSSINSEGGTFSVYYYPTTDCSGPEHSSSVNIPFDFPANNGPFTDVTKSVGIQIDCEVASESLFCAVDDASVYNIGATPVRLTGLEARPAGGLAGWLQQVLRWMINPLGW